MNLKDIADRLGGDVCGRDSVLAPGPGHSEKDRSLSILFRAADDFVVHSFTGQSFRLCRDYVREKIGLAGTTLSKQIGCARVQATKKEAKDTARLALRVWNSSRDPIGTLGEKYLNDRSLVLPGELRCSVLRFNHHVLFGSTSHPALIACFKSIKDGSIVAIHRIFLTEDGQKIERKMLGPTAGAVIALDKVEGDELYIGEGLETCLAARQLGMKPVWACGSCIGISKFPIIERIKTLHILGEDDSASDEAILECGGRWRNAGKRVHALFPNCEGDFNDELMGKGNG